MLKKNTMPIQYFLFFKMIYTRK